MSKITRQIEAAALDGVSCDAEGTLTRRYLFNEGFAGFAGHFPGQPILPAVVEILTVVALVGAHQGRQLRLAAVEDAKFLKPVLPNQELLVRCRPRQVRGRLLYDAELTVGGSVSATMLLGIAPAGESA